MSLCYSQCWDHPLLLLRFAAQPVRYPEADFHGVAFAHVDAVDEHFLLHAVCLERADVAAGLRPEV